MKLKTSELTGAELDWAVAKCEGQDLVFEDGELCLPSDYFRDGDPYKPSEDWAQGGPIVERERISVEPCFDWKWVAIRTESPNSAFEEEGPTPLIAAMRCYVASEMGEEVEVPDELQGEIA